MPAKRARATVRVLIVDDDDLVRTTLRRIIGRQPGLEVAAEASDGAAAVDLAEQIDADVIVMDVEMPCLSGVEATRTLRSRGVQTPVIFLTAHPDAAADAEPLAHVRVLVKANAGASVTVAAIRQAASGA